MGLYHLNLDELAAYKNMSIDELKSKSYAELESMIKEMETDKIIKRNNRNAEDAEYERLVLKYFTPLKMLKYWYDEKEIILACALTGVTAGDLCGECLVPPGCKCHYPNSEYIETAVRYVKQYDRSGRELAERIRKTMDIYRIAYQYQGLSHGKVILHLLYKRFPELSKFGFEAYEVDDTRDYEIYPKNGVYTSLNALMKGDIDWIIHRNREYSKYYNNGRYSPEECEKAFRTADVQEMFDVIRKVGEENRKAYLFSRLTWKNDDGLWENADDMIQACISDDTNIVLMWEKIRDAYSGCKRKFTLEYIAGCPYTIEQMLKQYVKMTGSVGINKTNIHICHVTDYLGDYSINVTHANGFNTKGNDIDISGYVPHNVFGVIYGTTADLTIRINCPEMIPKN